MRVWIVAALLSAIVGGCAPAHTGRAPLPSPVVKAPTAVSLRLPVCAMQKCAAGNAGCARRISSRLIPRARKMLPAARIVGSVRSIGPHHYYADARVSAGQRRLVTTRWASIGCHGGGQTSADQARRRLCRSEMAGWIEASRRDGVSSLRTNAGYRSVCLFD